MMEDCGYCKEKENKIRTYNEEIELEKIEECQKALEREKMYSRAKDILHTRENEIRLKEMQKLQMEEKKWMVMQDQETEEFWHRVLMNDYHRKEYEERMAAAKRQQEMVERRMCYDEQIASANRKRHDALRIEREKENKRLEKMKKKMEQDHFGAIKRKKDQQMMNKNNFIDGHEAKLARLRSEELKAREIDNGTIRAALENLRKEDERKRTKMKSLQMEKLVCLENYKRERRMASVLEEEAHKAADDCQKQAQQQTDEHLKEVDRQKICNKQKTIEDYRRYVELQNIETARVEQERQERMKRVNLAALSEIQRNIRNAEKAIQRQTDYRDSLSSQIRNNQKYLEMDLANTEDKDITFTKKAMMFKEAMANHYKASSGRTSTNPVHPFRRIMESKEGQGPVYLPSII